MHAQLYCTPPSGGPSKSGPEPLVEPMVQNSTDVSMLSILHVNIRGWLSHHVELEAHIRLLPKVPMFVVVNETFLNASVEAVKLSGYDIICRRDRDDGRQRGGILVFASTPNALNVTLLENQKWLKDVGVYFIPTVGLSYCAAGTGHPPQAKLTQS